ncbi:MAG: hypothetical protein QM767_18470 [Anaeromyxobacter sp.]
MAHDPGLETAPYTLRFTASSRAARLAATALGAWLIASVFLWPHATDERFNDVVVGLVVLMFAPAALWAPALRWVNTFAAAWLLLSAVAFKHFGTLNQLHDLAVGLALLVLSFIHGRRLAGSQEDLAEARS